ncbi:MAG TPA: FAD-dependent oxidoreductase [Geminicoccus sp.]|uniref:GcvT family protein n=1 Tax=Geminicoccus sp. TaxID=2024832 RepID=UPI002C214FA7|nr:FAD-dependent oxidoreductase [Geminicoccus sp.]HWL68392.1 FAD-dependent oxidoreductase [Geminicoccus sp.]
MSDTQARIVIIGGGAIGCAIAYHLARAGQRDVLLLEKAQLTHGSTWHAAGLVGQLRSKRNLTRLMQDSVAVFDRLEAESGQAIDWRKCGSLRIASSEERMAEIRRSLTQAKGFGFEAHEISAAEAKARFPFMTTEGVVGAAWISSDGYIDPYGLTQAFAAVARRDGVRIREGVLVTGFEKQGRRITAVLTDHGRIRCEIVVNCAGIWAKRVGEMAGVAIAAGAVEHQYMVTEKKLDLPKDLPTFRDPDRIFYLKPDVRAFAIGGWEKGAPACWQGGVPFEFGRELFPSDFERFEPIALGAAERLPVLNAVGIQTLINGPIPVSADGEPVMGLAPELDNFFVACGFTAGIAASGGAGLAMANWITQGDPGMDLWPFDIRRFARQQANRRYLAERSSEAYGNYYSIHWPVEELASARGARRSPLYDTLKARGAVYGSKAGWERPNWFRLPGSLAEERPSFLERPGWFEAVAAEHRAVRERVALIDLTSFSKFELAGSGAFAALQRIVANDLDRPVGSCVYTQCCNERGGIEADLTVMRLAEDRFYIVTGSQFGIRDAGWLRRHLPDGLELREVTGALAVIDLAGPRAREVLAAVSDDDVSDAALPYLSGREIEIGLGRAFAARIGYVGELGYELHVPVEHAAHVYEELRRAGEAHGIADVGYRALDTLRLEKGYVYWSSEVSPEIDPFSAGLGFAVALGKGPFIGRDALLRIREQGPARRLVTLGIDGFAPLVGGEVVLLDGRPVGSTTSAGFGHTVGHTVAFAFLPAALAKEERFEIEAYGQRWPVWRGRRALYDPKGERLRA